MAELTPELRAALLVARSWGVSPAEFAGAPAVSVTEYEYDQAGRLIRATTVTEPRWTDQDREAAYALDDWEASLCSGCGGDLTETTQRLHEYAYVADREREAICWRCQGQAAAGKPYEEHPYAHAMLIPLRLDEGRVAANRARMDQEEAAARGSGSEAGP